jgi:hypothetical protein
VTDLADNSVFLLARSLKAFFETDVKQLISTIRSSLLDIKTFAVDIEAETNSSSRLKEQYLDLQDDARRVFKYKNLI